MRIISTNAVLPRFVERESFSLGSTSGNLGLLGKAMLALAGAYLLRAAVESAVIPRWPAVAVAVVYAFLWIVPAARAPVKGWITSAVWAATSALILVPMVWELTLRFRFLPSAATAGVLGCYALLAFALTWRNHFVAVSWIVYGAASTAALALAVATHDLVSFLFALLVIIVLCEAAAALGRRSGVRFIVALSADAAIFALIWIYSGPAGSHAEYPNVAMPLILACAPVLLAVFAASASIQALLLRRGISFFETAQTLVAALLTAWTLLALWHDLAASVPGVICLALAVGGYAMVFAGFERMHAQRNYHVYATGSLALLLAGLYLCLPDGWLVLSAGALAVGMVLAGARTVHATLVFHGLALLAMAAIGAGLFASIAEAMVGSTPSVPSWEATIASIASILCYGAVAGSRMEGWWATPLRVTFAVFAVGAVASLLMRGLIFAVSTTVVPGAQHVAVVRSFASCVLVLYLAWQGSHRQKRELVWLAWSLLAFIASKILFEDLRHGHLGYTAASIFLFAMTILLVPRCLRSGNALTGDGRE
ncbi:MAG TPA: hypothetical protein VFU68_05450 [Terracidiphilus sp.]|nr:hypothetical protein [Terracidiphilus sp.]